MGSLSNYAENKVLNHLLIVGTAFTPPATLYLALFTNDPGEAGSLTDEADYTGYAREAITFAAASGRSITQSGQINFDQCTGGSNVITHWAIMDGDTEGAGNMLAYGAVVLANS